MHVDDFAPELRDSLRIMIRDDVIEELRMELGTIKDIGKKLAELCYCLEGDGDMLMAEAYDHWMAVLDHLRVISDPIIPVSEKLDHFPSVLANAEALQPGDIHARNALIVVAAQKASIAYEKMQSDSQDRLFATMLVARAARCFNYKFIAKTSIHALVEEMDKTVSIPLCLQKLRQLKDELSTYKRFADAAIDLANPPSLWDFWLINSLNLPTWFECAKEVAIMVPFSCQVERVFSLLSQGFSDNQNSCLEDVKSASVMIRYNNNWREKEREKLI